MSRDLTRELIVASGRRDTNESTLQKAYNLLAKHGKEKWPKSNIYLTFSKIPIEELYDKLVSYRSSLHREENRGEIAAIQTITNRLPYPFVDKLLELMTRTHSQTFKVPLAQLMTQQNVQTAMAKSREYLAMRKAKRAGPFRSFAAGSSTGKSTYVNACADSYKLARWVPTVMNEDVTVVEMVSRERFGVPVKEDWYTLPEKWYENVCRFGRSFRKHYFGYLLTDGRIVEENKALYKASIDYYRYTGGMSECIVQYLNAPWLDFTVQSGVSTIVARKNASTAAFIEDELPNVPGWYKLKMSWVEDACLNGRPFVNGDIGYLLGNGKVIPETVNMYKAANAYVARMKNSDITTGGQHYYQPMSVSIPKITIGGRSSVGMVAIETPDTKEWIVGAAIPNTLWYNLKRTWYEHIRENGRRWVPGVFGYRFADNKIVAETEEMFNEATKQHGVGSHPVQQVYEPGTTVRYRDIEAARRVLADILPYEELDKLITNIEDKPLDDFFETVARIAVFGSKILNIPQVHRSRLARGQYKVKVLPILTKDIMLPEIYADPARNPSIAEEGVMTWNDFDRIIDERVANVKESLKQNDTEHGRTAYEVITVGPVMNSGSDAVYYRDGDVMYAFNRPDVVNASVNPVTDRPFTDEFMRQVKLIHNPTRWANVEVAENVVEQPVVTGETTGMKRKRVAGDVDLYKLSKKAAFNFGDVCSYCGNPMSNAKYSSIYEGEPVNFCSSKCFADYRFIK